MREILSLLLCLVLPGCVSIQSKILSIQKGTPEDKAIKIVGVPSNEEDLSSSVTRLVYKRASLFSSPEEYWLYFNDNKYVFARLHTMYGFYDQIKDMNRLGLISNEDYQSQADSIQQRGLAAYSAVYGQRSYQQAPIFPIQPVYQRPAVNSGESYHTNCQTSGNNISCQTSSQEVYRSANY